MTHRPLGKTGLSVSPIAFGAFKIGRNQKIKYAQGYELPTDEQTAALLHGVLDLGINWIDTAPAYGLSEERIGRHLAPRRGEFLLSTKVGETFENGHSAYDFTSAGVRASLERSLRRLRTDAVDLLLIHSDGNDLDILGGDAVPTLLRLRQAGLARFIGLSGKTTVGAEAALAWADVLMVEYHPRDTSHEPILEQAAHQGVGVLVKKPLASGAIAPAEAIPFILRRPEVAALVVGGLSIEHLRQNLEIAT